MTQTNEAQGPRELDAQDIHAILARNTVGRLAFARGENIDVLPIQYVFRDGAIYGRTAANGKLVAAGDGGRRVAFEVDEIESAHSWRTVLTHGTLEVVDRSTGHEEWVRALGIVRRLFPAMLRREDPVPDRTEIFRIVVQSATGRALG